MSGPDERRGVSSQVTRNEIDEFKAFIADMELFNPPLLGRKYTWYKADGSAMSRLDRFLVSEEWITKWGVNAQWALKRDVSDHCPIILKSGIVDWGPKPFRFNNCWLKNQEFGKLVIDTWSMECPSTWKAIRLKEKLKRLKLEVRKWNMVSFGNIDSKITDLETSISDLDLRAEDRGLSETEVRSRKELFAELWQKLRDKESMLRQKSRQKWLSKGDANTAYFHACIKARQRQNQIVAILVDDTWVEGPDEVKNEVQNYYMKGFAEVDGVRPVLDGITFRSLEVTESSVLTAYFTMEELEEAVMSCHGDKAPGPDDFNFNFIKKFWETLKVDFWEMLQEFFGNARLPKGITSYFLALIPKCSNPQGLRDYRPISLLGSIYKILAKILASRLRVCMNSIIAPNQFAFLPARNILDGAVIINEVVDFAKKSKRKCLIFKVDFEKAYDSVNWNFLDYMMRRFGMNEKWRGWIKECVFRGDLSVLINGSPTEKVKIQKGLKQGDPLAPFLFLLVVEGLTGMVKKAGEIGIFKGFKVGNGGEEVSILQYADDTLLVGEATLENLWAMKAILRCFELVSCLKVNFHKSRVIGINVEQNFQQEAALFLNCKQGGIPFRYLGVPIGANLKKLQTWQPVIDLLNRKLSA